MTLRVDPFGRALAQPQHEIVIRETANERTGVITYSWRCTGCSFAYGFDLPTEEAARNAAAIHAPRPKTGRASTPFSIVKRKAG